VYSTPYWLPTAREWLSFITAFFLSVASIWKGRWIIRKMKEAWLYLTGVGTLNKRIHEVSEKLDNALRLNTETLAVVAKIRSELQPNGGSSLHDVVHSILAAQRARDDRDDTSLFWTDAEGRMTHVNRAYLQLSGRTREELLGTGWVNVIASDDRYRITKLWRDAISEQRDFDETFLVQDMTTNTQQIHARATRLLGTGGRLLGYYGELRRMA
jgi:PAS domain S-box-containing protein